MGETVAFSKNDSVIKNFDGQPYMKYYEDKNRNPYLKTLLVPLGVEIRGNLYVLY